MFPHEKNEFLSRWGTNRQNTAYKLINGNDNVKENYNDNNKLKYEVRYLKIKKEWNSKRI